MKVDRTQLLTELEMVSPGLSSRDIIEQSGCFVFTGNDVMTFNDEIACTHSTCLKIKGAVQAEPLLAILRKLTDDTLRFNVTTGEEGTELVISGKKRRAGMTMEKEVLLPIDTVDKPKKKKWKKMPNDYADAISYVKDCAGKDQTRFSLTCIHIHPDYIEACDGYQIGRYKTNFAVKRPVLVPKESLGYIESLGMSEIGETKNWMHFRNANGLVLSCRRYVEDYRDLTEMLDKAKGTSIKLPKGVKEAAERAEVFTDDSVSDNQIKLQLRQNEVRVSGTGTNGWYKEKRRMTYKGPKLSFFVSPALLTKLIDKYESCEIESNQLSVRLGKFQYLTVLTDVE